MIVVWDGIRCRSTGPRLRGSRRFERCSTLVPRNRYSESRGPPCCKDRIKEHNPRQLELIVLFVQMIILQRDWIPSTLHTWPLLLWSTNVSEAATSSKFQEQLLDGFCTYILSLSSSACSISPTETAGPRPSDSETFSGF